MASATGPSWAGPENIRSSKILSTGHVCRVHGHEELEDPWNPARPGLRPRFLDPICLAEVPNVVQGGQEHPLFELLGRAPEHRPPESWSFEVVRVAWFLIMNVGFR